MRRVYIVVFCLLATSSMASPLQLPSTDMVVVYKAQRLLELYHAGTVIASYPVHLGFQPTGVKRREGDGRTPEGLYSIVSHNPKSRYHLSLEISYPGPDDLADAAAMNASAGGKVMIHGIPNGARNIKDPGDWTDGCIAVDNKAIEQIYASVQDGTPVMIVP